jgi:hypothetical protein
VQNCADKWHAVVVELVMSGVGRVHWVGGMNGLAGVAVMSLMHMVVLFGKNDVSEEEDPQHRPCGQKRAVVESVRKCPQVCLHACGLRLARPHLRTLVEHVGNYRLSPACETVSAAVCVLV